MVRICIYLLLCLSLLSPAAHAGAPNARELFEEGRAAFATSNYLEAIRKFEAAYAASQRANILWNIATAYRRQYDVSGDLQFLRRARIVYANYGELARSESDREDGKREAERAAQEIDARETGKPAAPPPPSVAPTVAAHEPPPPPVTLAPPPSSEAVHVVSPEPEKRPVYRRWYFWTAIVGVAVAAVAVGVVAAAMSQSGPTLPDVNGGSITPFGAVAF